MRLTKLIITLICIPEFPIPVARQIQTQILHQIQVAVLAVNQTIVRRKVNQVMTQVTVEKAAMAATVPDLWTLTMSVKQTNNDYFLYIKRYKNIFFNYIKCFQNIKYESNYLKDCVKKNKKDQFGMNEINKFPLNNF